MKYNDDSKNEKLKIICDLVHGYIKITSDVEAVINTDSFQRLKFINQTSARHLYPSTNHTRFEHSLGVMKLAEEFFINLENQFEKKYKEDKISSKKNKSRIKSNRMHLKYGALLHDMGMRHYHIWEKNFMIKRTFREE